MAKRSRRARRQESQKQTPVAPQTPVTPKPAPVKPAAPVPVAGKATALNGKVVNFAQEYFYVYHDLRNVLIISVLMLVVLVGLSFAI